RGGSGDPGHDTAVGVFHGIRAACAQAFGADDLAGRTVIVQGAGSVGRTLVGLLADAGAEVLVADVDETRAAAAAAAGGATVVAAADAVGTPCDVLAPCATGGLLSEETIPGLKCRVIAGSANNQLATPEDAGRLHEAGILYAPDYVVNAGGVIHLAGYETLGWDAATVGDRLVAIGRTLAEVFDAAARDGVTPSEAADRHARARIEAARPAPG
ncbi:MAG TPA: Glu/Leu/Phe/Val dehydrogenase family protein, partial [Actinomycetota bacterium]